MSRTCERRYRNQWQKNHERLDIDQEFKSLGHALMPMRESPPEWFTPVCLFGKHCDLFQLGVELPESFALDAQPRERHHRQCRATLVIPRIKARGWYLKGGNNVSFMVAQSGVVPASHSIACVVAIAIGGDHCIWKIFARRICSTLNRLRFCGCCLRYFRMVHAQWAILGAPSPQASGMRSGFQPAYIRSENGRTGDSAFC